MSDATDATLSNPEGPPQTSPPPPGRRIFQSPSLLFVLLRIFIYIALSTGITFALQWITAALMPGERSLYSPKILTISEGSLLAGAFAAGAAMSQLGGRSFCDFRLSTPGAFCKMFLQGAMFGLAAISVLTR